MESHLGAGPGIGAVGEVPGEPNLRRCLFSGLTLNLHDLEKEPFLKLCSLGASLPHLSGGVCRGGRGTSHGSGDPYLQVRLSGEEPREWTRCVKATEGQLYRQYDSTLTWKELGRGCPVLIPPLFASLISPRLLEVSTHSCPK